MEAGYSKHDLPPRCRPGAFLLLSCLNSGSVQISKPTSGEDTTDKFHIMDKASPQRKSEEDKDWEIYLTHLCHSRTSRHAAWQAWGADNKDKLTGRYCWELDTTGCCPSTLYAYNQLAPALKIYEVLPLSWTITRREKKIQTQMWL